jgi:hypothetical protein
VRDDLDRVPLVAVRVFPRAAPQAPVHTDLSSLDEVLGAELGLLVPGRDADEVGLVLPRPVDGEQEVGDLPVLTEILELDVCRKVPDQRDDVHLRLTSSVD